MSKKVLLTIATLVLVITLSSIGVSCGPSQPSQFLTYTDEANGFSIDYPQGWSIEHPKDPPELKVSIYEKKYAFNPVGILVGKYQIPGLSLEGFYVSRIEALLDSCADYASISTEELTINGRPAIKHIYTGIPVAPTPYKFVEVYLVQNGTEWILKFSCPQESFDSYKSTFDTALNSFRPLK